MDRWKAEMERVREKRKSQKKEDADARKGRKVAKHSVFPMICGSGGSKSRLAKAAGAEPAGQMRDEKLHAAAARSTFPCENVQKTHHGRTTFASWDVEKVHAVVARSTFPSRNLQNTRVRTTFGSSDVEKSARRCGAKHISKSKCSNTRRSDHFWRFRCRFASLHYTTLHYTTLHYTTLQDITLHYTPVHYITLHYTPVHSTTLNYTTPHYITPHYITLNDTAPQIDRQTDRQIDR